MEPGFRIELFIDKRPNGILQPNGMLGNINYSDFYINVPLTKNVATFEDYVNVVLDPFKTSIKRQMINPYFIELGFFETISSVSGSTDSITEKVKSFGLTINK